MEKPITIKTKELRENIIDVLNKSNLPWWKVFDELRCTILPMVQDAVVAEEQAELEMYNMALIEEKNQLEEKRKERVEKKGVDE